MRTVDFNNERDRAVDNFKFRLMYAGVLPFILLAFMVLASNLTLIVLEKAQLVELFQLYCLLIATFMAGVHWGQHAAVSSRVSNILLASSNIHFLILFFCFFLLPTLWFLGICLTVFCSILAIDTYLYKLKTIDIDYFTARAVLTAVVVICILIVSILM